MCSTTLSRVASHRSACSTGCRANSISCGCMDELKLGERVDNALSIAGRLSASAGDTSGERREQHRATVSVASFDCSALLSRSVGPCPLTFAKRFAHCVGKFGVMRRARDEHRSATGA